MMRFAASAVVLTAVYAMTLASLDPWDLGIGALLAVAMLTAFRRFIFPREPHPARQIVQRAMCAPALLLATVANIVRGTVLVARVVLGLSSSKSANFVEVPQGDRTESGMVVSGLLDTLSPGSVLIEIDDRRNSWTIHALDASNPDAVREELREFYDRYQRPVWP